MKNQDSKLDPVLQQVISEESDIIAKEYQARVADSQRRDLWVELNASRRNARPKKRQLDVPWWKKLFHIPSFSSFAQGVAFAAVVFGLFLTITLPHTFKNRSEAPVSNPTAISDVHSRTDTGQQIAARDQAESIQWNLTPNGATARASRVPEFAAVEKLPVVVVFSPRSDEITVRLGDSAGLHGRARNVPTSPLSAALAYPRAYEVALFGSLPSGRAISAAGYFALGFADQSGADRGSPRDAKLTRLRLTLQLPSGETFELVEQSLPSE